MLTEMPNTTFGIFRHDFRHYLSRSTIDTPGVVADWIYTSRFGGNILRPVVTLATIPNTGPHDNTSVIAAPRQLHAVVQGNFERFVGAIARSVLTFKDQLGIYYHGEATIEGRTGYGILGIGHNIKTFSRAKIESSTSEFSSKNISK